MRLMLFVGALALVTTAACADQFAGFYGNALHVTDSDGHASTIWVNADKTWEQHEPGGRSAHGTWAMKDDSHFCIVVTDPPPDPGKPQDTECHEMTGNHKVGDTWTITDPDGTKATMSLTAGHQ